MSETPRTDALMRQHIDSFRRGEPVTVEVINREMIEMRDLALSMESDLTRTREALREALDGWAKADALAEPCYVDEKRITELRKENNLE